ncbi:poly(U)-specific endoribonuclease homolog [Agrilus planipennis]|uniref:Poly(U)-specific endoribonuclease homolog n=1 Tax=Agrilus planipennis TaxID=224129 RepID=A0A7F5RBR7_AGRPL|nr:poly(U)-specific endoribonuclease homolog [Agrilus planipennis]
MNNSSTEELNRKSPIGGSSYSETRSTSPNTSLSNLEWPELGQSSRRNSHISTSTQNSLTNRQNTPISSPWDSPRSTSSTKSSPLHPKPNKPSFASVAFINNERGDGQVAPPQSGSISPTSNHNTNNNNPSPQSSTRSPTNNSPPLHPTNNRPPSPQSSVQSPTNNNPPSPQLGTASPTNNRSPSPQSPINNRPSSHGSTTSHVSNIRNNKPSSQSSPQSWPRPPANPQSHLKPISASGNKKPETVDINEDDVTNRQQTNPTEDQELREFSENLLRKEINSAMNTITVNYQGQTTSRSLKDEAPLPLIAVTNGTFKIATIELLRPLYDNYILETAQNEHVTPMEREEENKLLDAVVNTQVMRFTRNFLIDKGKIGKDPKEFRDYLKQIWFTMYSRGKGKIGSSGFEHVFLTEIRDSQISGLHNWLYFYEEESRGNADYLGYMRKIEFGNKGSILKFHFKFRNIDKPVGSMFIGTSPEFEMALYTTCFALRANRICPLQLDGKRFIIRTYSMRYRGKENIGSAFPEI